MNKVNVIMVAIFACVLAGPVGAQELNADQTVVLNETLSAPAENMEQDNQQITNDEGYGDSDAEYYGSEGNAANEEVSGGEEENTIDNELLDNETMTNEVEPEAGDEMLPDDGAPLPDYNNSAMPEEGNPTFNAEDPVAAVNAVNP